MRQGPVDRAVEQINLLDALLRERDGLLTVMDRIVALHGTARLIRATLGVDSGFVADLDGTDQAVVRWMSGTRTDLLQNLTVPLGQGIGGRAMALGQAVRVSDYVSSHEITHHFDAQVRGEGLGAMIAVPVISKSRTVAVAYAAMRSATDFGDTAVQRMEGIAEQAATALHIAGAAESKATSAVTAERHRMQNALHDSVGALLFSIGVQVRDLHQAIQDNPPLETRLSRLESDISAASSALRESLLALSDTTPERALPVELAEYARSFEARTGVTTRFVQLGQVAPMDSERTALLLAVVREGLLNIEKHSRPHSVIVTLGPCDGGVQLVVADDGAGAAPSDSNGTRMGVRSLAERAARVAGRVSLVRDEDGGCTLRAWLPDPA
ncbi:GAF domain-containing protein [Streptomyces sp. GESEQ-35]|uniref:GAF domain-containing sensor histidine kinase n=1 Tax=Streptomyces sp. GESEQ-35 TaxID=2812657 RepID=UPI001B342D48|nr:GAF domain-containing protein [Streptomyces sp. GESEQ-35]